NLILAPLFMRKSYFLRSRNNLSHMCVDANSDLPKKYFIIGIIMYLLIFSKIAEIPSFISIFSTGSLLVVCGICLNCWQALCRKERGKVTFWLLFSFVLPFVTIIKQGFLGYG